MQNGDTNQETKRFAPGADRVLGKNYGVRGENNGGRSWMLRACDDQQIRNGDAAAREENARGVVLDR